MDEKDREIADLKARLEARHGPGAAAGRGFSGGFFGCFGVAAAIGGVLLVLIVVAMMNDSGGGEPLPGEVAYTGANNFVNAGHCVNAMHQARAQGTIDATQSALAFPWRIEDLGSPGGRPTLSCAVTDQGLPKTIRVEVLCADSEIETCSRLIGTPAGG